MRYASGVGDDAQLYIPPALASLPAADLLVVTEGEKKAAKAVQEGIHCVAVQGVWSWADSGDRAIEKSGKRASTQRHQSGGEARVCPAELVRRATSSKAAGGGLFDGGWM